MAAATTRQVSKRAVTPIALDTPAREAATPASRWQRFFCSQATSTTRASSSPATSAQVERRSRGVGLSARRSLGQQLEDLEVFDMAASDCDTELNKSFDILHHCTASKRSRSHDICRQAASSSLSPRHSLLAAALRDKSDVQPDAWSMEDWSSSHHFSPVSSGCHTSPCSAAQKLDKVQRVIADAVLAELQVDLESAMQKTAHQMRSWISEEIIFVRKGIVQDQVVQCNDLRSSQGELQKKIEDIHVSVDESLLAMQRTIQSTPGPSKAGDEFGTPDRRFGTPDRRRKSAHVMEATMVAEERRWRMKLDGIEGTLSKHLESIDTLGKQLALFSTKFAGYDVDLHDSRQAIRAMDAQLRAVGEKARLESRTQFETQLEMLEALRKQCRDIDAAGEKDRVATRVQFETHLEKFDSLRRQCGDMKAAGEKDRLESRAHFETHLVTLETHLEMIDSLRTKFGDIETHAAGPDDAVATTLLTLETRLSAQEAEKRILKEELGKRFNSLDALGKQACLLAKQVNSHGDNIQLSAQLIEKLELKFTAELGEQASHLATHLAEQVALQSSGIQSNARGIERLEVSVTAAETSRLSAEERVAQQIQEMSGAIKAQIFAAEQIYTRVLTGEQDVAAICSKLQAQLKSKVDSTRFSSTLAIVDEVTTRLGEAAEATQEEVQRHESQLKDLVDIATSTKEDIHWHESRLKDLVEELSHRAKSTDVNVLGLELKAWVEAACDTHQKTITELSDIISQARITSDEQNVILKKHEQWIMDISTSAAS